MKKIILFICFSFVIFAEIISGKVTKILDGDTIYLSIDKNGLSEIKSIRFHGIDAPEIDQTFGKNSQQILEKWLKNKTVKCEILEKDKYNRDIAKVYLDDFYINLGLVRGGFAWHYSQYSPDDLDLNSAQKMAEKEKKGLWNEKNITPPWDFRHGTSTGVVIPSNKITEKKIDAIKTTYWVTKNSRKVHNSKCRYFKNSVGYETTTTTTNNKNCKICGGNS